MSSLNIDKEMVDKILGEINMSEEDLEEGVVTMKQWITTQPHLPPSAQNDTLLKAFIISCESVENAKNVLLEYYDCRTKFYEPFFKERDPREIKWKSCHKFVRLPGLSPDGYIVNLMTLPNKSEVKDFDLIQHCRASFMGLDTAVSTGSPDYMTAGHLMLFDASNFSARLMLKLMFNLAGQSSQIVQKAYPIKIIACVTFNAPALTEFFFNTFMKPFLTEELRKRNFIFSSDHSVLKKYIPIEMLPCDYEGGQSPPLDQLWSKMQERIIGNRNWLLNEGSELISEDLRPKPTSMQQA